MDLIKLEDETINSINEKQERNADVSEYSDCELRLLLINYLNKNFGYDEKLNEKVNEEIENAYQDFKRNILI